MDYDKKCKVVPTEMVSFTKGARYKRSEMQKRANKVRIQDWNEPVLFPGWLQNEGHDPQKKKEGTCTPNQKRGRESPKLKLREGFPKVEMREILPQNRNKICVPKSEGTSMFQKQNKNNEIQ